LGRAKGRRTRCTHSATPPRISSIQDVLDQAEEAKPTNSANTATIETQQLLDRAKAPLKKKATSKTPAVSSHRPVTRSMSVAVGPQFAQLAVKIREASPETQALDPCTPADQLTKPTTPMAPVAPTTKDVFPSPPSPRFASHSPSPGPGEGRTRTYRTIRARKCTKPPPSKVKKARPEPIAASDVEVDVDDAEPEALKSILDQSALFADATDRLAGFATMAPEARHRALEDFYIRHLHDDNFRVLCRAADALVNGASPA
jgi:hypothetical protein